MLKASKLLAQNLAGKGTGPDAFTLNRKDGTSVELEIQTFPVKLMNRRMVLGSARDITKRRQAEQKMEEALALEENANRVKSLFLENISHEIRTPLNSILGFAEILEDRLKEKMTEAEHFMISNLQESGERLMRTVHEILDIAQFESGNIEVHPAELLFDSLVASVMNDHHPLAKEKGLELRFKNMTEVALVKIDEDTMRKALVHLMDNAIKYTEKGYVELLLRQEKDTLCLRIKDTGIGISPGYLKNLYQAFSQESEGYSKRFQGLGVGLALAKSYLDINDVKLQVESQQQKGTTFTLTLPLIKGNGEQSIHPQEVQMAPAGDTDMTSEKAMVMVVEDDLLFQNLLRYYLSETYQVCFAQSVEGARKQLEEHEVHLVLVDLSLKGPEDGLDLVRYMRKLKPYTETPIIAVTAHAFQWDRANVMEAGCNDYLTKPVKPERILEYIEKYLGPSGRSKGLN